MRPQAEFPPGRMWRPLLRQSRVDLRHYAERNGLSWVEDPHNLDSRYARSFLRGEIFPRLSQRWPGAVEQLARTAEHCADAVTLLDELAGRDFRAAVIPAKAGRFSALSVQKLLHLPLGRRNNVVRFWVSHAGFEIPPFDALQRFEKEVLRARPDASPLLAWGDTELRRFRDGLYLMHRLPPPPQGVTLEWDGRADLKLPEGCGVLRAIKPATAEMPLRVSFMRGGERLKPAGSRYTRTLRNLFQEEAIATWIRERMPLIYLEGELAAIADRWEIPALQKLRKRERCRYEWEHSLPGGAG
jgi:tRNA(Ile)-lysidine synthase